MKILISCEHASNAVPPDFAPLFEKATLVLETHRGYDIGAAELAGEIASACGAKLFPGEATRLLIDLNRSPHNRKGLFSEFTDSLGKKEKVLILENHYRPYREAVESYISNTLASGETVLHLSVHSFTPVFEGKERNCQIGILYDPAREADLPAARLLRKLISEKLPHFKVRMNYPYRGRSDGFVPYLRKKHVNDSYMGIELEINQQLAVDGGERWKETKSRLVEAFSCVDGMLD